MKEISLKVEESKPQFFSELIKNIDFLQVDGHNGDSKEEIKAKLPEGLKQLRKYKKGELETTSAKNFIDVL